MYCRKDQIYENIKYQRKGYSPYYDVSEGLDQVNMKLFTEQFEDCV